MYYSHSLNFQVVQAAIYEYSKIRYFSVCKKKPLKISVKINQEYLNVKNGKYKTVAETVFEVRQLKCCA